MWGVFLNVLCIVLFNTFCFLGGFCSKMPVISAVFPLHCINRFWLIQLIFISQFEKKDVVENILLIPEALQFC